MKHGLKNLCKSIEPVVPAGVLFAFGLLSLASCGGAADNGKETAGVVARLGSLDLTRTEVFENMPGGLTSGDSARFVKAYVNNWVDSHLVSEVAAGEIDMSEIDRLVADYRNTLIMQEYRRRMFEAHAAFVPDDSVKAYYELHKDEFVLERPMVKGTYLKVPDDAKNLSVLRRLYRSDKAGDADRLEKEVLSSAIHYDYFRDRWVDWEQIETRIPYDFGSSEALWLKNNRSLDRSLGGFTYLLYITDVLPAGKPMPLDAARNLVVNRLINQNRKAYDAQLMQTLRSEAEADGRLRYFIEL